MALKFGSWKNKKEIRTTQNHMKRGLCLKLKLKIKSALRKLNIYYRNFDAMKNITKNK